MRILHLIHTPRHSGAEVLVRDLCLRHAAQGHACAVASFGPSTPAFETELEKLTGAGVSVFVPDRATTRVGRVLQYAQALNLSRPDVVFAHSAFPALYGRVAMLVARSKARFVSVLHSGTDDYAARTMRQAERLLMWRADGVIAVSQSAADTYTRRFPNKPVDIIKNGVNLAPFTSAREMRAEVRASLGIAPRDRLIVQVGRIAPVKGQVFTVEALSPLLEQDTRLRLWFAGIVEVVDYARQLTATISARSGDDRVRYLGPRTDVPNLLAAADVYVMPSRSEAHSIAFLEAMASGTPIVATDIPSFAFAHGMSNVDLVPQDDSAEFLRRVAHRLAAADRFSPDMTSFDLRQTADQYLQLAEHLCASST